MSIDDLNKLSAVNGLSNQINKINNNLQNKTDKVDDTVGKLSFKDQLQNFIGDVNQLQKEADTSVNKLAAGEVTDVHDVMVKVEEANLSFSLMMEIRNKIVEGYKEVLKTSV